MLTSTRCLQGCVQCGDRGDGAGPGKRALARLPQGQGGRSAPLQAVRPEVGHWHLCRWGTGTGEFWHVLSYFRESNGQFRCREDTTWPSSERLAGWLHPYCNQQLYFSPKSSTQAKRYYQLKPTRAKLGIGLFLFILFMHAVCMNSPPRSFTTHFIF